MLWVQQPAAVQLLRGCVCAHVSDAQVQIQLLGNDHFGARRREAAAFGLKRMLLCFSEEQDVVALMRPRRCLLLNVNIKWRRSKLRILRLQVKNIL